MDPHPDAFKTTKPGGGSGTKPTTKPTQKPTQKPTHAPTSKPGGDLCDDINCEDIDWEVIKDLSVPREVIITIVVVICCILIGIGIYYAFKYSHKINKIRIGPEYF